VRVAPSETPEAAQVVSVIVPESFATPVSPAPVTDPVKVPDARANMPVPPTITSVRSANAGPPVGPRPRQAPIHVGLLKNSSL
jgi:hypothetical protein